MNIKAYYPLLAFASFEMVLGEPAPPPVSSNLPATSVAAPGSAPAPPPSTSSPNLVVAPTNGQGTAAGSNGGSSATPTPEEAYVDGLRRELSRLSLERDKLMAENSITRAKLEKELADRRADLDRERLRLEEQKQKEDSHAADERRKLEDELTRLRTQSERLQLENSVVKAQAEIEATKLKTKEAEARAQIVTLQTKMERQDVEMNANNYTGAKPLYLENPLEGNSLTISDRRIALNGPITSDTADFISNRINYFNNKDAKYPIFIIIDSSPGGSVMAGYHILKSMESSQAPVFVVVKSFAASMAACIATCADKSFCYPNAVVLHHQIAGGSFGNLTRHRENLKEIEQWWNRLSEPVAKKMGLTTNDFIKRMYEQVSTGDWTEFGDKATELKWVDHVVKEIRETSLLKNPDSVKPPTPSQHPIIIPLPRPGFDDNGSLAFVEQNDEKGQPYVKLPRLAPKDFYYLYNPDGYYRMQ
ncbi:MAG: ATP-dependent Clp protease proteolytic subunit [Verrucomicrobiales bacterium]